MKTKAGRKGKTKAKKEKEKQKDEKGEATGGRKEGRGKDGIPRHVSYSFIYRIFSTPLL